VHGRRARYISPFAVFLFLIFVMFFVFTLAGGPDFARLGNELSASDRADLVEELADAREEAAKARARLAEARAELRPGETARAAGLDLAERAIRMADERVALRQAELAQHDSGAGPAAADDRTWQERVAESAREGEIFKIAGAPAFSAALNHKLENPDLALYKLQQAAYKFSFLLVPISLPFVALLFVWKRGLTLYDHAVFVLYSLAFMSLLFVAAALAVRWAPLQGFISPAVSTAVPVHMYFQLKGGYALGWFSAAWRTLFLLIGAFLSLIIFGVLIVVLGLAG